jgi:glycosyltransferase involved in cell wall biosynthesis
MNILIIGNTDLHGRKFNGMLLYEKMKSLGSNVEFRVWEKKSNGRSVGKLINLVEWFFIKIAMKLESYLSLQSLLSPLLFILPWKKYYRKADIIHLQMIHFGFFNLFLLPYISRKKIIYWTLHDPWPLSGHCVHPKIAQCQKWLTGCGNCPDLGILFPLRRDTTKNLLRIKRFIFRHSKLVVHVASEFMYASVIKSRMFRNSTIIKIPFGVDIEKYKPGDSDACRRRLGIGQNQFVISFRATNVEFKGIGYILSLMERMEPDPNITILTFNERGLIDKFIGKFKIIELGWLNDDEDLICAYRSSNVFLMPSKAESFGFMAVEAMACGTPVITFNNTALTETVAYGKAGVLVEEGDIEAMKKEIIKLRQNSEYAQNISKKGAEYARAMYDQERYFSDLNGSYRSSYLKKNGHY